MQFNLHLEINDLENKKCIRIFCIKEDEQAEKQINQSKLARVNWLKWTCPCERSSALQAFVNYSAPTPTEMNKSTIDIIR